MTKALIPIEQNTEISPSKRDKYKKERNRILDELRCISGLPIILKDLNKDTLYKLVAKPKGAKLFKDAAGNLKGVFYKEGKIVKHAKFKAVRPSLVKAASAVGSQIMLISISMQLNRIEDGIRTISKDLHNDRISEIFSGVNLFNQAILTVDPNNKKQLITNAIQNLNTGLEKSIQSLREQIEKAPSSELGFWDNWLRNKATIASRDFELAEESFRSCLLGIKTLAECFAELNEPKVVETCLPDYLSKLKEAGVVSAAEKARLIPANNGEYPERIWLNFLEGYDSMKQKINDYLSIRRQEIECIEVEFRPSELVE